VLTHARKCFVVDGMHRFGPILVPARAAGAAYHWRAQLGLRRGVVSDCHCPSSRSSSRESSSPQWPAGSQSSADARGRRGSYSAPPSARSPSDCYWLRRPAVARHAGLERAVGRAGARDVASNSGAGGRGRRSASLVRPRRVRPRRSPRPRLSRSEVLDVWPQP